jgi:cytochrome c556
MAGLFMVVRLSGQPDGVTTKEFMREKLDHSKNVLEALTEEDYFTLNKHAKRLSAMTQEAKWQAFQNPDYVQHSTAFRRHANALTKAAEDKNIDAATLAYVRLTMSCIDCHKFVRGKLIGATSATERGS